MTRSACILGCQGTTLTADERAFFRDADPWGFIVFARNLDTPDQVRRLTGALRDTVDGVDKAGAVHLFNGETGELIGTFNNPFPNRYAPIMMPDVYPPGQG